MELARQRLFRAQTAVFPRSLAGILIAVTMVAGCQTTSLPEETKPPGEMDCAEINAEISQLAKELIRAERRAAKKAALSSGGQPNLRRNQGSSERGKGESVFARYEERLDKLSSESHARSCGSTTIIKTPEN